MEISQLLPEGHADRKSGKKISSFTSDQGVTGNLITGEEESKNLFQFIIFKDDHCYSFYALSPQDYYATHEQIFEQVAKSLTIKR